LKQTEKLKFSVVDVFENEGIKETINSFSNNFEKIDGLHKENLIGIDELVEGSIHEKLKIYYNSNPAINGYIGWVNLQEGKYAPPWVSKNQYMIGDMVVATEDNGHVYKALSNGYSSYTEPSFPTSTGSKIYDLNLVNNWISEYVYSVGDVIISGENSTVYYQCTIAGTSDVTPPTWDIVVGTSFGDGTVTWLVRRTVEWQEVGNSSQFRPFGRIE